ncbi:MAG TPA: zinc ribbon domain-containing protein, partial [Candidatus Dormibacteraeota bacterium]|nr:zinc ribbon domain-containing protein [Candidatus Dormibacteraeota bacterium]
MTCTSCGATNDAAQKFCGECGARLAVVCGTCGASSPPGRKFCGECGAAMAPGTGGRQPVETRPGRESSSGGSSGPAPGPLPVAERRLVTVLFADLV